MKFLLIEYEPRYLERIRQYLANQSQTVELVMARDGEEGLDLYRESRPDLVLISSVLPKLRTPDVIKGMQAMGPTPPVLLMMSGYKGRNKRADAHRVGATSILEKPFSEEVFQAEVAMALGLRPAIEMPPSAGPPSDPGAPLLSADDIFSDVLTGLDDAPPARPPSREMPLPVPAVDKRLSDTLSGLLPPRKTPSGVSAPFPAAEVPGGRPEKPVERTARVNVAEAMASLSARPQPAPRATEASSRSVSSSSSVDKLLHDTLSGILPPPKTTAPAPPAGSREPREASREVSGVTVRMKATPLPPPVPPAPPPMQRPVDATRPVSTPRPASSPGAFGRYQLLEKIGAGGMAEVFKARMSGEQGFEKIVAIKRIVPHMATNADFVTMFVDEAKLAAQLNHNNITHIYDLGKVDAWHYIAMEYVEGKDLRTLLKLAKDRGFPLPAELALFIASKIANALDYAHRRPAADGSELNLVHRDVSPQNILISDEGDIKLCDFGIAKAASKVSTTISGALKGKLQYMSPEQAWGKRVDRRSDVFSLGSVLFEMLTGAPLFEGETDMSVLESVREGEVATPSSRGADVPKRVDQILLKALAKNPQERYQNASEFEKDLHAVLYTYQPAPGPADLAIYMHRLLQTPQASDDEIDAAFDKARDLSEPVRPAASPAAPPKKGKGLVISKAQTGEFARPAIPEPRHEAVRPEPAPRRAVLESPAALPASGESRKSRVGLFAGIGIAAVALVAGGLFVTKDRWLGGTKAPASAPAPKIEPPATGAASAASAASAVPSPAAPVEPAKVVDPRAVEAEARRLAAERDKAARDAGKAGAGKAASPSVPPAAAVGLAPVKAAEPPRPDVPAVAVKVPEPAPASAPVVRAPETKAAETLTEAPKSGPLPAPPVEVSVPEKVRTIPVPSSAPVKEGDLVGPGEGVVEPRLVRLGNLINLPVQARQIKRGVDGSIGTPFLMALIDERGVVQEVRVLKPSSYKFVDEAAVRSLKGATIQPATKDGVKVKMWKTFPINVKP